MKAAFVAAALLGGVSAANSHHRHGHELFHAARRNASEVCTPGCTTIYTTITGSAGLWTPPVTEAPPAPSTTGPATVPTPIPNTCPTPGTYTFPATTLTLTETVTACAASTTTVPSGTHTLGGITTVVTTATTITCPYATTKPSGTTVTSVIETTTYVCPSAGTYTIAPITTTVTVHETVVVIPVYTTYCPGTYTAPAVVTTITETDTVVYCPFSSSTPAPAPAAATSAPAAPAAPSQQATTGNLGGKGGLWGMTYTPYTPEGQCKSADQVNADIAKVAAAGFTTVRVYSTDCNTLPNVGAACAAHGVKMIIGIFIGGPGCDNASPDVAEQLNSIVSWAKWDLVELIIVGNEAMFGGHCDVGQLKALITHTRDVCGGAGYTGPYTTTDVVSSWLAPGTEALCDVIDHIACNAHAYFNVDTPPESAGPYVQGQLALVEAICPGKKAWVTETGWPSAGAHQAGAQQQETALLSIKQTMGEQVIFFSLFDDLWKQPGDCGCEQSFGCGHVFGITSD